MDGELRAHDDEQAIPEVAAPEDRRPQASRPPGALGRRTAAEIDKARRDARAAFIGSSGNLR